MVYIWDLLQVYSYNLSLYDPLVSFIRKHFLWHDVQICLLLDELSVWLVVLRIYVALAIFQSL